MAKYPSLLGVLVCTLFFCAISHAQRIVPRDNGPLMSDLIAAGVKYESNAFTRHLPAGATDARPAALLRRAAQLYDPGDAAPDYGALVSEIGALREAGEDDPALAIVVQIGGSNAAAMEAALRRGAERGVAPIVLARGRLALAAMRGDEDAARRDVEAAMGELAAALSEDLPGLARRYLLIAALDGSGRTVETLSPAHSEILCERMGGIERRDAWTIELLNGRARIAEAWLVRGGDDARRVTPEAIGRFEVLLRAAYMRLSEAHRLAPDRPEAATGLITTLMGLSRPVKADESAAVWFERAVEAQFDWRPAYDAYLLAIAKRWNQQRPGAREAKLGFARACAATGRHDTFVPRVALEAVLSYIEDWRDLNVWNRDGIGTMCQGVIDEVLKSPDSEDAALYTRSLGAVIAYRMADLPRARRMLDEVGGNPDPAPLERTCTHRQDLLEDVYLLTSEAAEKARAAERAWGEGTLKEAVAALEAIRDGEALASEHARRGLAVRLALARWGWALARGEWAALPVDDGLSCWYQRGGEWKSDGGVMVADASEEAARAIFRGGTPANFEYAVSVEFSEPADGAARSAGVIFGWEWGSIGRPRWMSASLFPDLGQANVALGFHERDLFEAKTRGRANELLVRIVGDRIAVEVNGERVFDGPCPSDGKWAAGELIGVGCFKGQPAAPIIRFSNPRVRAIKDGAVP